MNKTLKILIAPLVLCVLLLASTAVAVETPAAGSEDMQGMMTHKMDMMKKGMMTEKMAGETPMDHDMMAKDECPLGYDECPLGQHKGMKHREHRSQAMKHDMGGMGHGMMMPGMMQRRMDHVFYLDRIDALELSTEQVSKLKAIRNDCRRDNIRQAAETQITRLELMEMLDLPDWSLKQVEPLVRQAQKQEADMQVRHLKAMQDARLVLNAEQREKVVADGDDPEELFQ